MGAMSQASNRNQAGSSYIVHEAIIDDDRRKNAFGLMMSLNMLIETYGGFDYSGADHRLRRKLFTIDSLPHWFQFAVYENSPSPACASSVWGKASAAIVFGGTD